MGTLKVRVNSGLQTDWHRMHICGQRDTAMEGRYIGRCEAPVIVFVSKLWYHLSAQESQYMLHFVSH